jgi:hypothetical protein
MSEGECISHICDRGRGLSQPPESISPYEDGVYRDDGMICFEN